MNRFYSNGELFVDLSQVSCVAFESAVIGGVQVKISEAAAFDLRRQVRAYKEATDKKSESFNHALVAHSRLIAWLADLIGSRIVRRESAKKIPTNSGLEGSENVAIN
jgi:hypothetical protein